MILDILFGIFLLAVLEIVLVAGWFFAVDISDHVHDRRTHRRLAELEEHARLSQLQILQLDWLWDQPTHEPPKGNGVQYP